MQHELYVFKWLYWKVSFFFGILFSDENKRILSIKI